jgi:TP901 family phage tail tape measure protein
LGGGLNGALSLAAAGALGVGEAAEIAASALTQFKLSGDQVPHIADLLAAGAGKAQGSVQDLGAALNQSGLVAASTGLTIEETTGALASFASAGLTGSDAGTSFKTMLMSLNPNSKQAAQLMDQLGIHAYDAQGNFIGMSEYAGVLQNALKGLSDEQRNATLKTLFGSDAVRAANILYEQGAAGIEKWESAVNDAGFAAETAAMMQDNLAGDIEKLGGSLDTVFLKSGSGANDFLRGLTQGAEDVVDAIGKIPAPILSAGAGIAGVVGVGALAAGAFLNLTPKVLDAVQAFDRLVPAGGRARGTLVAVGKAAGIAGGIAAVVTVVAKLAEADYMSKIDTGMGKVADALADVARNSPGASAALDSLFKDRDGGDLVRDVTDVESALKRTFNRDWQQQFNDWGESLVNGITGVQGSSQILAGSFDRLDQGLAGLVSGGRTKDAEDAFNQIKEAADAQGVSVDQLKEKFPEYEDALAAASAESKNVQADGVAAAGAITGVGTASSGAAPVTEEVAKALEDIGLSAEGTVTNLAKFTEALTNAGLLQLSARDAARNLEAAIDGVTDSVAANGTTLDITTEKGRTNQAALDAVASAGLNLAKANANAGASEQSLQGNLTDTYNKLVASAGQFGITGGAADSLARKVLGIPPGVSIQSWMSSAAKSMAEQTAGAINAIPTSKTVTVTYQETTIQRVIREISGGGAPVGAGTVLAPKKATGGRVPGYAEGGRLPSDGPGTGTVDGILGVSTITGLPTARVDAGEWVINRRSSDKYHGVLAAINAGTYKAYASGGRVGSQSSAGVVENHYHYHVDAKPGLASEYAMDIARQTATRTQDMQAAYGS